MRLAGLLFSIGSLLIFLIALIGCRSHGVLVTVRNDSGADVRNLEVQYPGGSFGKSLLPRESAYSYRVKVLRGGGILVAFEDASGNMHSGTGPTYSSNADGNLTVTINTQNALTFSER